MDEEYVEWEDPRMISGSFGGRELFFMSGKRVNGKWEFAERSTWEIRYYPAASTPERIQEAEKRLAQKRKIGTAA